MSKTGTASILRQQQGFTIIETMIVLAVSAAMFLSVVLLVNGKQQTSEFNSALSDLRGQLQQTSTDVVNGYYPSNPNGCTANGGIPRLTTSYQDSGECVYVGKAIHFYSQTDNARDDQYSVYTIVGARSGTDYPSAHMLLFAATDDTNTGSGNRNGAGVDITQTSKLEYGLTVRKVTYQVNNSAPSDVGSFVFAQSLSDGVGTAPDDFGSSQHSQLLVLKGTGGTTGSSIRNNQKAEATAVNSLLDSGSYTTNGAVTICLKSGTTNKYATIRISNGTSQLDMSTKISGAACDS